jgi:hypothetical protein
VPGGNLADRRAAFTASATGDDGAAGQAVAASADATETGPAGAGPVGAGPAMPVMPFPTFENVPTLPQQSPGNGYESGRDSRAR